MMSDKTLRGLLVDNNPTELLLLEETLKEVGASGYTLTRVKRLDEALRCMHDQHFDIVLLDLGLPDSQGLETLARMQREHPAIPILIVSNRNDDELAAQAVQHGAQDYLFKGEINGANLARAIRHAIERKTFQQQILASEMGYRRLFETAQDGIFILNAQTGQITDANPFLEQLLGYTITEFIGKRLWEVGAFRDKAASKAAFRTLQEIGYICYDDIPLVTKDGRQINVEFVSNIYAVGDTQVIQCNIRDITERRRAELAEQESKRFLQSTLDALSAHIAVLDETGKIIAVNQSWRQFAEENDGAAITCGGGANYLEVCEKATGAWAREAPAVAQGIREVIASQHLVFCIEYPCHSPSQERWFNVYVTRFGGEGAVHVAVAHENITARKLAEAALLKVNEELELHVIERTAELSLTNEQLQSEMAERRSVEETLYKNHEFLEAVLENTAEGIVACDAQGQLTFFNRATREFHGLPHEPLPADRWPEYYSLYLPDGITPMQKEDVPLFRALSGDHVRDMEMVIAPHQGSARLLIANGEPLFDADGAKLGAVVVMHDITGGKQTETALRLSEEKFRLLWATAGDAFVIFGADNIIIEANHSVATIFGYPPEDVIGQNLSMLQPAWLREGHKRGIERYLASGERTLDWRAAQAIGLHRDGHEFPVEIAFNHLHLEGKDLFAGLIRDITVREAEAEALRVAIEKADTANLAKSEFLSRMSHELRTPLNAILGFGQILDKQELTPLASESVGYILKGGRHLLDLINEVLDIARVEAGRIDLSLEPIALNDVVPDACALVRPLAAERDIRLLENLGDLGGSYILADRQRIKQVIINLVSNGIKYNREGGQVEIACSQKSDGRIAIAVRDTGPGISAQDLLKLFTPFERLGAAGSQIEGTGLGLVLSQRLVAAMEGTLTVESVLGVGTTFTIELPQTTSPEEQVTNVPETMRDVESIRPSANGHLEFGRTFSVLCIEDNPSNVRLMEAILVGRPEIKLLAAMQGSVGIDLARQHEPDVILLDLDLPDIHGSEVLARLQQSAITRDIPVVVVSADATPNQIERLLAAGAREYLTKPLDVSQFLQTLDKFLQATPDAVQLNDEKEVV